MNKQEEQAGSINKEWMLKFVLPVITVLCMGAAALVQIERVQDDILDLKQTKVDAGVYNLQVKEFNKDVDSINRKIDELARTVDDRSNEILSAVRSRQ